MTMWIEVRVHTATTNRTTENTMTKSNTTTQKARLAKFLAKTEEATAAQAARSCSIANVSAVISDLRNEGHVIWTNRRTASNGKTVFVYRYDSARSAANLR